VDLAVKLAVNGVASGGGLREVERQFTELVSV
jgi:hypothetical protein